MPFRFIITINLIIINFQKLQFFDTALRLCEFSNVFNNFKTYTINQLVYYFDVSTKFHRKTWTRKNKPSSKIIRLFRKNNSLVYHQFNFFHFRAKNYMAYDLGFDNENTTADYTR